MRLCISVLSFPGADGTETAGNEQSHECLLPVDCACVQAYMLEKVHVLANEHPRYPQEDRIK